MGNKFAQRIGQLAWVTVLVGALVAGCGGDGSHRNDGDTTGSTTSGDTTGGSTTGGDTTGGDTTGGDTTGGDTTGGGTTGGSTTGADTLSCAEFYTPDKLRSAPASCKPQAGTICRVSDSALLLQREPIACSGVSSTEHTVSTSDFTSSYYALRGSHQQYEAIYVGLHYLLADKGAFLNIVRLQELAKSRRALVLVPQAPSATPLIRTSRWPTGTLLDSFMVDPTIAWLQAVVRDARNRYGVSDSVPVYVAGLSNGAVMAYLYGCRDRSVRAVLAVASDGSESAIENYCTANHPLGSVIVHGTGDLVTPYNGIPLLFTKSIPDIHAYFNSINGCNTAALTVGVPRYIDGIGVTIRYSPANSCARRNFLVTVDGGGHNWPGLEKNVNLGNVLFGAHTANFDATLQGYDLLRLAAGN